VPHMVDVGPKRALEPVEIVDAAEAACILVIAENERRLIHRPLGGIAHDERGGGPRRLDGA
jgi:hypothetical protein